MNPLFELFNWRIRSFLAVGWLRFLYLFSILISILSIGILCWLVGNQQDVSIATRTLQGAGIFFGFLILLFYLRILIEFLISIFYIENHLRAIANRSDSFEIPD